MMKKAPACVRRYSRAKSRKPRSMIVKLPGSGAMRSSTFTSCILPSETWINEGMLRIEPPCFNDQGVREIAINAPVALLVGIGQIAACDVPANTEMIEFGLLRAQTDFDVAQALTKRQLRKRHAQVLIQM